MLRFSIVVPAYMEQLVIGGSLDRLATYLRGSNLLEITEVIVVTADSTDKTADIVRKKANKFLHFQFIEPGPKVGKGRDVRMGIEAARGEYVLFTDADLATPEHHIMPMFTKLQQGSDVVIGVRKIHKTHTGLRALVSIFSNWLVRLLLLRGIPDSQCGFKGFTKSSAKKIFSRSVIDGWGFDMEVLAIARVQKMNVSLMPIYDWHDPKVDQGLVGESTVSASIKTFKELLLIRKLRKKGKYA